ncbi:MAG: uroporphyrinogen-III synthase [Pseudomonadota bacterium]
MQDSRPDHTAKRLIIVTRPAPDGPSLIQSLAEIGEDAHFAPVMDIAPNDVAVDMTNVTSLAFTSANGVRAFAEKSDRRELPVFAVGPATAKAAATAGFTNVNAADGDVRALARLISSAPIFQPQTTGTVLHVAGVHRAGDLCALLQEHGISSRREVIYEATARERISPQTLSAIDNALSEQREVLALFYSARSAQLFIAQTQAAGASDRFKKIAAVCLKAPIGEAASIADWSRIVIADEINDAEDPFIKLITRGIHAAAP